MAVADYLNVVTTPVRDALRALWIGVGALLATVVVMWIFNFVGLRGVNVPIALTGTLLIAMVGFRATNVVGFGFLGAIIWALQDKDKSQGAATGLIWLTELFIALGMAFVLAAFTLMTWSFKESPGAFWIMFFGVTLILLTHQHFKVKQTNLPWILITGYAVVCMAVTGWTTFGGAYTGHSFNPETGIAKFMRDPATDQIIKKDPAKCRPIRWSWDHFWFVRPAHQGFDYAKDGTCFTGTAEGVRLVPMSTEDVIKRNPGAWPKAAATGAAAAASTVGNSGQKAVDTIGEMTGATPDQVSRTLNLLLWVISIIIAFVLLRKVLRSRPAAATVAGGVVARPTPEPWGKKSAAEWASSINSAAMGWFVLVVVAGAIGLVLLIAGGVSGTFDDVSELPLKMKHAAACTTQDEVWDVRVDTAGKDIVFCPEKGSITMFAESGRRLVVDFSPKFKRENEHLLHGRSLHDFVEVHPPQTYLGSLAESWKITPVQSQPGKNLYSAWEKSGLADIALYVRAE